MRSLLETLTHEREQLTSRLAELEAQRQNIRAEMEADPMRRAAALAPKFGELQTQIEVFAPKLAEVNKRIEAEQKRLNSPEVKAGVKRAGQIVANGQRLHNEVIAQAGEMIARIDAALAESQEAASLLRVAGQDFTPHSGIYTELAQVRQMVGGWIFARSERANITAGFKQAEAAKQAREQAATAAEAKAKAAAAKHKEAEKEAKAREAKQNQQNWNLIGRAFNPK